MAKSDIDKVCWSGEIPEDADPPLTKAALKKELAELKMFLMSKRGTGQEPSKALRQAYGAAQFAKTNQAIYASTVAMLTFDTRPELWTNEELLKYQRIYQLWRWMKIAENEGERAVAADAKLLNDMLTTRVIPTRAAREEFVKKTVWPESPKN